MIARQHAQNMIFPAARVAGFPKCCHCPAARVAAFPKCCHILLSIPAQQYPPIENTKENTSFNSCLASMFFFQFLLSKHIRSDREVREVGMDVPPVGHWHTDMELRHD